MGEPVTINTRIVEALYSEALVLADEVRARFSPPPRGLACIEDEDLARVAFSSEGLRTTTRMMHAMAWLLNHRAYLMGELSEFQLRRHGKLANDVRASEPSERALLPADARHLVAATERFYDRLKRLDGEWRTANPASPGAITRLRERLEQRVAGQRPF